MGETTIVDIILPEGGVIAGRVTYENGTGIADAYVEVYNWTLSIWEDDITNETGYYSIVGLLGGNYTVTAYPPYGSNLLSNSTTASVTLGETTIVDIILPEGGVIAGRVTYENGTGIYDARVRASGPSYKDAYTNETGYYSIVGLLGGNYMVTAYPPYGANLISNSTTASVTLGETTIVDIILPEGGKIAGRVTYENGTGIYNARVKASGPSYEDDYTNETGYYSIVGLLGGNYTVTAYPPYGANLISNSTTASVTLGETTIVDIILPEGGKIAGRVTYENGTGIYDARVRAFGPSYKDAYTNETGYYSIVGLLGGNYTVTAHPPYGSNLLTNSTTASVTLGETTTVNFVLLLPPDIGVYPAYFDVILPPDNITNRTLIVGNDGDVVLEFNITEGSNIFFDDTESSENNWTYNGLWHRTEHRHHSPSHAWYYGIEGQWNYNNGFSNSGSLISPPINLTTINNVMLTFWYWYETETAGTSYDQRWIKISVNGGPFTNLQLLSNDAMQTWHQKTIDLSAYAGNTVQIMFYFDTIDSAANNYEGWYIDDVIIIGATDIDWLSGLPIDGTVSAGSQTNIILTINATSLEVDEYNATILINSNDPDENLVIVPVHLIVAPTAGFDFDTGSPSNPYPSISGMHNGTIKPNRTIEVSTLYTYPCSGTGGHTEYARIWNSTLDVNATWNGYVGDWHNISFDEPFTLFAEKTYYYEVRTGSYPQIIHTDEWEAKGGMGIINCTSFVDANGKIYNDWIPAIRLE